jgi:Secretion system C-terminal sorting domain
MTKLKFQMPKSGFAELKVFDALGKEIQVIVNQELSPGTYDVDFDGSNLPSGVYYYRLETKEITQTGKMVLLK